PTLTGVSQTRILGWPSRQSRRGRPEGARRSSVVYSSMRRTRAPGPRGLQSAAGSSVYRSRRGNSRWTAGESSGVDGGATPIADAVRTTWFGTEVFSVSSGGALAYATAPTVENS